MRKKVKQWGGVGQKHSPHEHTDVSSQQRSSVLFLFLKIHPGVLKRFLVEKNGEDQANASAEACEAFNVEANGRKWPEIV